MKKKKFRSFPTQADLSVRAEKSPFFYASDEFRMNFYVADSFFSDILYRNEKCICIDILPSSSTDHHVLLSFYYGRDEHSMWMVRALEDIITSAAANTYTTHVPTSENKILQMETSDFFSFSLKEEKYATGINTSALWGHSTIRKMQIVLLVQICIADEVNQQKKRFGKKFTLERTHFQTAVNFFFCKVRPASSCSITCICEPQHDWKLTEITFCALSYTSKQSCLHTF